MHDAVVRRRLAPMCALLFASAASGMVSGCGGDAGALEPPGTQATQGADSSSASVSATGMPMLRGVSLAGAEFGEGSLPGNYGTTYAYPSTDEAGHFLDLRMNIIRLPFRWERLQRAQGAELDPAERFRLDTLVSYITSRGAYVLIDPHNYARYYGGVIGDGVPASAFADFWTRLASLYKDNDHVIFGLMNEPNSMSTETWVADANAAIAAIRATGAKNLIFVPGNGWTGAWSWSMASYGTPNATAMLGIEDPGHNFAIELHQYLDGDSSGGNMGYCVSPTIGSERLSEVTEWLRQHGLRAFLGEFGTGNSPTCLAAMADLVAFMEAHRSQWMGWAYWAAGPLWNGSLGSIEPSGGQDAPQTSELEKFMR